MSRHVTSFANQTLQTCTLSGAKVKTSEGFEDTENESTAENRQVYYQVSCKTCGSVYYKTKGKLAKPHKCLSCHTVHAAAKPVVVNEPAKQSSILVLGEDTLLLVEGEVSAAITLLTEEQRAIWVASGGKVAAHKGAGVFETVRTQSKVMPELEEANLLCSEPLQETLATPKQAEPEWQPTRENPIPYAGVPPAVNWAEPINLQRTDEQERDTIDCEGFHRDLRRQQEFCNLFPHSPKRKTFSGWLISQANLERLQNKQMPYTDSQLIEKKAGVKDIPNEFEGAPLTYFAQAAAKVNGCRGWLYLYEYHEEFDPVVHRLPVEALIKADLAGLSRAKETYRQWHLKKLAEETKAQEAQ